MSTPAICLCVIAGREEATIERFLESWLPAVDAVAIVEAIGTQESDNTLRLARNLCDARNIPIATGVYKNKIPWPHVDDFAAARQQSFELSETALRNAIPTADDWLVWADVDDLYQGAPDALRNLATSSDEVDLWSLPYNVPDCGKVIYRERLVSADAWHKCRWHSPVHEVIASKDSVRRGRSALATWLHAPTEKKERDAKRNLRILTAALAETPAMLFYVAQEYNSAGNVPNMQRFAKLFLDTPRGDPSMQYQALLWLSTAADTHREASQHALAAYWLYPYGEALAALVRCAMQENDGPKALRFAEILARTPPPEVPLWCHEPRWYGWAGKDLHVRALRMCHGDKSADAVEQFYRDEQHGEYDDVQTVIMDVTDDDATTAIRRRELWYARAARPLCLKWFYRLPKESPARKWLTGFRCIEPHEELLSSAIIAGEEVPAQDWGAKFIR